MIDIDFFWIEEKANAGSAAVSHSSGWRHPLSTLMAVFLELLPRDGRPSVHGEL